jgi:hypothetical protein
METPSVQVLMSVFHGEEFLEEQLASLANQEDVRVTLLAHLDADEPRSKALIDGCGLSLEWAPLSPALGIPHAYFQLLPLVDPTADYWAFSDQDDIWAPRKLAIAAEALHRAGSQPALWVSRVRPFSDGGGARHFLDPVPVNVPRPSLGNALVQNIGPGCDMVANRALLDLLCTALPTLGVLVHDQWVYLVAAAFGAVIVDARALMDYRLHQGNTIGISRSLRARTKRTMTSFRDPEAATPATQARAFLNCFGDRLTPEQRDLVRDVADRRRGPLIQDFRGGRITRQVPRENPLMLARLLAGR